MTKMNLKKAFAYAPLVLGIAILGVGSLFVPWREVTPHLARLDMSSYIAIAVLGVAYYASRIVRYHYMLGVLNAPRSFVKTILSYFTAQPISLLPAGEAYRVVTLQEHSKVPKSKGISIVFIQSFTENIAMVLLALMSAIVLKQYVVIVLGLLLLYLVIFIFIRTKRTARRSHKILNKLPFVSFARSKFDSFIHKNKTLLSGSSLAVLIGSGFISTLIASTLLFIVANDMDLKIDYLHAIIAFTLPTVLQNISFLPGGIGINEQGSVGLLVLLGASLPAAVAVTIIMRFVTLALGVFLGLISIIVAKLRTKN
jgi:uncharacterized protein (TIRG00374 family)